MSKHTRIQVALPVPLRETFDYLLGDEISQPPPTGARVRVPFAGRELIGVVLGHSDDGNLEPGKLKSLQAVLDRSPVIPSELISLIRWSANYYQCPLGEALQAALPTLLRQGDMPTYKADSSILPWQLTPEGQGLPDTALPRAPRQAELLKYLRDYGPQTWPHLKEVGFNRDALKKLHQRGLIEQSQSPKQAPSREQALALNPEQQVALDAITLDQFQTYLLEGTTGSGKTEIYLQAISRLFTRDSRAQALILVPEIGLAPQTIQRFQRRFGSAKVVALHSGLSDRERLNAWVRACDASAQIIIGTRSAIFTPLPHAGLIIVDEEHDASFKQQEGFRYCARDLACLRGKTLNIPVILGSATPALETLHNALRDRFTHLQLTRRASNHPPPRIQLVDSSDISAQQGLSEQSLSAINHHLKAGNQVLVFLNRRGYAPTLQCHDCGNQILCRHCDARLTLHHQPRHLHCHHCDWQQPVLSHCPICNSHRLVALGQGTERSEEFLTQYFPDTDIIRIDRDSTRTKNALSDKLERVHQGAPCILVGTQMIAKGHHFRNLTLAVILDVDSGLLSADFRGPERMGQLITQVAGRAGREQKPGEVILQSRNQNHPLLQLLVSGDYQAFSRALLTEREVTRMPPFSHLALIRADAPVADTAAQFLQVVRHFADAYTANLGAELLGPMPALMEKRGNRYRFLMQVKSDSRAAINQLCQLLVEYIGTLKTHRALRWSIDVDPQEMN
ncbi:primosomal protein N' [Gilvimarinus xylanilyticus]|uniref:Replication restart protein PriA n=1 Tax=Gilvimarinus xylanilyticus TaxID=2944139 RepID=A0A9X2HZ48_9GAMM|nr:primosomal protein N' [Gilvimarinus xylanilyticus]MCP8900730.1 primosomal protein N' [Gilvimarinus xylanilyticus]